MRRTLQVLGIAGLWLAGGCSSPSLSGLGAEGRVTLDGLEGVWQSDDFVAQIELDDAADRRYTYTVPGSHYTVQFHVIDFDGRSVTDSTLLGGDELESIDPLLGAFVIPVHKFARIELRGDELAYADLRDRWVRDNAPDQSPYADGDAVAMTGDDAALRALIRRALDDPDAFQDETVLQRLTPAESGGSP